MRKPKNMVSEGYVSFETAKLLKEKGFNCDRKYVLALYNELGFFAPLNTGDKDYYDYDDFDEYDFIAPTFQQAINAIKEIFNIIIVADYEYECTDTSWYYKIYLLGENGKPESVAIKGVSYDKDGTEHEHIVGYRDYERSREEYATRYEAEEAGIRYCLEKFV